jgi:hypothetical protein
MMRRRGNLRQVIMGSLRRGRVSLRGQCLHYWLIRLIRPLLSTLARSFVRQPPTALCYKGSLIDRDTCMTPHGRRYGGYTWS